MMNQPSESIFAFHNLLPHIAEDCFLAPHSVVIGDVEIGEGSSIWFQTVIRGDVNAIRIGRRTNIQDLSMVHVTQRGAVRPSPTWIGDDVTIGHRALLHGCHIGHRCLIGMGSIIMDRVRIGDDCIIGAGSLVTEGTEIPAGSLVMGSPARIKRTVTEEEKKFLILSAKNYYHLSRQYKDASIETQ